MGNYVFAMVKRFRFLERKSEGAAEKQNIRMKIKSVHMEV